MRAPLSSLLLLLSLASAASAQVRLGDRVEEGVTDYEPSRLGLRVVNPDLREDTGFDHIYRVEGRDDLFARRHGGVTAVFPRSVYYRTRKGVEYTVIPSGTVFYIGDAPAPPEDGPPVPTPRPPRATLAEPIAASVSGRLNPASPSPTLAVRADRAEPPPPEDDQKAVEDAEPAPTRTMSDEMYRRTRLKQVAARLGPAGEAD